MRRALIRRLLTERPGATGIAWISRFSEPFTGTQYTALPSVNAAWVNDHGTNRIGTGGTTLGSAGESRSHLTTELSNTQAAQLTILNSNASTQGIIVRATAGSAAYWGFTGYAIVITNNASVDIYRANSGTGTLLASKARTIASGDVLRVEAIDGEITAFINGTAVISAIDYTYRGGFVGVFSGGTLDAWGDDFQAFDVNGPYVAQEASVQFAAETTKTVSLTVSVGSMLVVAVAELTGRSWRVDTSPNGLLRDSQNNVWTELTENQEASNAFRVRLSYAKNVVAGATNVTITNAFGGGQGHFVLYEVKRADASAPFVVESYHDDPSGSTTHFCGAPGGISSGEVGIAFAVSVVTLDRGAQTVRSNWRRTTVTGGSALAPYHVIQYRECPSGINAERGEWFQPNGSAGSSGAGVIAYFKIAADGATPKTSSDTLGLAMSDAGVLSAAVGGSDTAALGSSESGGLEVGASSSDASALATSESGSLASDDAKSASDTAALGTSDAGTMAATVAGTESASLVTSEASALASAVAGTDGAALSTSDVGAVAASASSADTSALGTTEAGTTDNVDTKSSADTAALATSDVSSLAAAQLGTDTLAVTLTEAPNLSAALAASDALPVTIADVAAAAVAASSSDIVALATTESGAVIVVDMRASSDTLALAAAEVAAAIAALDGVDVAAVTLVEVPALVALLLSSDVLSAAIAHGSSVVVAGAATTYTVLTISRHGVTPHIGGTATVTPSPGGRARTWREE